MPLTYGVGLVRTLLTGEGMSIPLALAVTAAFGVAMFGVATASARARMDPK